MYSYSIRYIYFNVLIDISCGGVACGRDLGVVRFSFFFL